MFLEDSVVSSWLPEDEFDHFILDLIDNVHYMANVMPCEVTYCKAPTILW